MPCFLQVLAEDVDLFPDSTEARAFGKFWEEKQADETSWKKKIRCGWSPEVCLGVLLMGWMTLVSPSLQPLQNKGTASPF